MLLPRYFEDPQTLHVNTTPLMLILFLFLQQKVRSKRHENFPLTLPY